MDKLFFTLFFCLTIYQAQPQKTVNMSGQMDKGSSSEFIYLASDQNLLKLEILEEGTFTAAIA